jgi:hypothetical protein
MNPFQTVSYAPIDAFRDLANLEHAGPGVCNGILLLWQTFVAVCAAWKQAHERQAEKLDDVGTNVPPRCRPTVLPASIIYVQFDRVVCSWVHKCRHGRRCPRRSSSCCLKS